MSKARPQVLEVRGRVDMRTAWRLAEGAVRWYGLVHARLEGDAISIRLEPRWWWRAIGLGKWAERRGLEIAVRSLSRYRPGTLFVGKPWKVK